MLQGTSGKRSTSEVTHLIDRRVANLRESIRVLHSQRNGLFPISKLPAEILTEIFLLHQQNVTENYTVETVDWIGITHVSQRWREIAVNFSGLWTHIPFYHPKWAEEMIARSQHACLIVRATYNRPKYSSQGQLLKSFLQKHLSRVQVLEVQNTSPQLFQDIQPTSVPHLSTLTLSTPWQDPVTESSPLQIIDSRLLNTTLLRKLEVSTTLGWDSMLFSGLTQLRLGDGRNMPRTRTSQRDFLDALRRMPTLQSLHLKGPALPETVDRSLLEPVYLPDLQDLSVSDTVPTIEFFLHHVAFPPTTRTAISCKQLDSAFQLANILPVLVLLKRLLSDRRYTSKIHHIEFPCFESYGDWGMIDLSFKGWVSSGPSSLGHEGYNPNFPSDNPDFTFFVQWKWRVDSLPSDVDEFIAGMFGIFPRDDVVSLSLSSYSIHDTWFTPFSRDIGQLPALNTLFLNHISSTPILLDLDCDVPQEGVNPSAATYPALLYLDFTNCGIDTPALKTLYDCLKKRSERGLGPRKLRVDLRGVREVDEKATALVEKVVEVVWLIESADSEDSYPTSDD